MNPSYDPSRSRQSSGSRENPLAANAIAPRGDCVLHARSRSPVRPPLALSSFHASTEARLFPFPRSPLGRAVRDVSPTDVRRA